MWDVKMSFLVHLSLLLEKTRKIYSMMDQPLEGLDST
jgi:hypothetical protein